MRNNSQRMAATVMLACLAITAPIALAQDTTTPIKHLVIIFQENESFDHYFGSYPKAKNSPGEPRFVGREDPPPHLSMVSTADCSFKIQTEPPPRRSGLTVAKIHHLRSVPQLHPGTTSIRRRTHGQVSSIHRQSVQRSNLSQPCAIRYRRRDGILRRQYGYRALELRSGLCDERQLPWHEFWSIRCWRREFGLRHDRQRRLESGR